MAQGIGRCFGAVGTGGLGEDVTYMAGDGTEADTEGIHVKRDTLWYQPVSAIA